MFSPRYALRKTWSPGIYQGGLRRGRGRRGYFEGWYNKIVSPQGDVFAFIPGVSYREDGNGGAFVQYIDGETTKTGYYSYNIEDFSYAKERYDISIVGSSFSDRGLKVALEDSDGSIAGEIAYKEQTALSSSFLSPGIMGWYTFAPFMECYHGIVSLDHELEGELMIRGRPVDFTGGRGYIEKDWGRSFPSSWVWVQSNHFADTGISFMLSVAMIPWLRNSFPGFLCVLLVDGKQYRFATYTGATVDSLSANDRSVAAVISNSKYRLRIDVEAGRPGGLKAPANGSMTRIITESVTSLVSLELQDTHGGILFKDAGRFGGLEIAGDTRELVTSGTPGPSHFVSRLSLMILYQPDL